ncbi:MAG TPA: hypothetical protein VM791_06415 [Vicinamibacterales bacterium]|nr:hypothetical protein [Vicinamibacterales bacterium]
MSASLVNGPDVSLVNLSRSGALIEVASRYPMKAFVRLKLVRTPEAVTIAAGTVLWSKVNAIVNGQVSYLMAVVFEKPIADMEGATGIRTEEPEKPSPPPSAPPALSPDPPIVAEAIRIDAVVPIDIVAPSVAPPPVVDAEGRHEAQAVAQAEAEQRRWDDEKSRLLPELTAATARAEALQASLETRDQEHRQALGEQHDRYQTIIADMIKASTDQHVELSRQRDASEHQRTEFENRIRDLQAQVQVLELRNAAYEGRHRMLRQEVERLLSICTTPADGPVAQRDNVTEFPSPASATHAIA